MKHNGFRPLSWGLSFNGALELMEEKDFDPVFVPFLGDFLSMYHGHVEPSFKIEVFVPFLGDFLSI